MYIGIYQNLINGHKEGVKIRSFLLSLPHAKNRNRKYVLMKNFKILIVPVSNFVPINVDMTILIQFFILYTQFWILNSNIVMAFSE